MSWQDYVDKSLIGTGVVSKASIHGLDGTKWASSPGFTVRVMNHVKSSAMRAKAMDCGLWAVGCGREREREREGHKARHTQRERRTAAWLIVSLFCAMLCCGHERERLQERRERERERESCVWLLDRVTYRERERVKACWSVSGSAVICTSQTLVPAFCTAAAAAACLSLALLGLLSLRACASLERLIAIGDVIILFRVSLRLPPSVCTSSYCCAIGLAYWFIGQTVVMKNRPKFLKFKKTVFLKMQSFSLSLSLSLCGLPSCAHLRTNRPNCSPHPISQGCT